MKLFRDEAEFINWVRRRVPQNAPGLRLGIGDDAALIEVKRGREIILTADMSIQSVHFLIPEHPARSVGHRALARALSDVAAMGGTPRFALISLALSLRTSRKWVKAFFSGMLRLAERLGVVVIGGDTAFSEGGVYVDVTAIGEVAKGRALTRAGARPGDLIFVSGPLGLAALGLRLVRRRAPPRSRLERRARRAHLWPSPQCALGRFLSGERLASAAIDLSDGLSMDLARLCKASRRGARVRQALLPVPKARHSEGFSTEDALALALHGGEDYGLLFTVEKRHAARIPRTFQGVPLYHIGEITGKAGMVLVRSDGKEVTIPRSGYDHFRATENG